ncbi:MAG TPA: response regulator transcription factor [Chitinophagaceae bacterium]|nr:response regulator transcription factor [Chitinophagaceae bacterium]
MIKLFIVDDHYMVIEGVHSMMKQEKNIEWMGHATNADSCLYFLKNHRPDVILMDISMPGKSGIELCGEVNQQFPGIAIIALSTFNQGSYITKMMEHGAMGYVLKNASREELMEAIEAAAKGRRFLSFEVAAMMRKQEQQEIILTRREKEVLELISSGMTNGEIAEKLFIGVTTVISHRKNILEKFNVNNTAALLKKAFEGGYL